LLDFYFSASFFLPPAGLLEAKAKAAGNASRSRPIEKAAAALLAGEIRVHLFGGFALVVNKDGEVYKVNGKCECKAAMAGHRECYHRAAAKLWERYEAAPAVESKTERRDGSERAGNLSPPLNRTRRRNHDEQ
jgi:hypothetical protein